jgi:hypothetical protein
MDTLELGPTRLNRVNGSYTYQIIKFYSRDALVHA